jgi:hypothetical protein
MGSEPTRDDGDDMVDDKQARDGTSNDQAQE